MIEQRRNLIAQFISTLGVGNRNPRPVRLQKKRRRHPGLPEANHQHAFVFKFHQFISPPFGFAQGRFRHRVAERSELLFFLLCDSVVNDFHRSFSVVSANSANTSDAIQNRTIIFDSDHPINSK